MANGDYVTWPVSSVSYCSICTRSLPLEKLVKFAVTSLTINQTSEIEAVCWCDDELMAISATFSFK